MSEERLFSFSNLDPWVVLCRSVWAIKEPFLILHQPPDRTVAVLQSHVGRMCSSRGWWRFWCATFHFPLGSIHTGWLKSPCQCAWMTVKTTQDRLKQIKNSTSDQKSKSFHPRHICGQRLQRKKLFLLAGTVFGNHKNNCRGSKRRWLSLWSSVGQSVTSH